MTDSCQRCSVCPAPCSCAINKKHAQAARYTAILGALLRSTQLTPNTPDGESCFLGPVRPCTKKMNPGNRPATRLYHQKGKSGRRSDPPPEAPPAPRGRTNPPLHSRLLFENEGNREIWTPNVPAASPAVGPAGEPAGTPAWIC